METLTDILAHFANYLSGLDWSYIITFIILSYGINHYKVLDGLQKATGKTVRTRYRVFLIGLLYGVAIYFVRSYTIEKAENLFQSFVFALVFHKLIVEAFIYWLAKHALPESICKHLMGEEEYSQLTKTE